jgi:hypothetical protein
VTSRALGPEAKFGTAAPDRVHCRGRHAGPADAFGDALRPGAVHADAGQRLARAFGATCTFHVFVLDRARRLRYEGRFDDTRLEERVTRHDVADVLDDLLADRRVRVTSTLPFGCSLDFTSAGPAVMLDA